MIRPLCFVQFNGRNDNLGDVLIFRALVASLREKADVYEFAMLSRRKRLMLMALRWLARKPILLFGHLGARISSWQGSPLDQRLETALGQRRIYLGLSVIPGTLHPDLDGAAFIGVRDTASLEALRAQGHLQTCLFPDALFMLPSVKGASQGGRNKLLVSFRASVPENHRNPQYAVSLGRIVPELVLQIAKKHDLEPVFYFQVDEDESFNAQLAAACSSAGATFVSEKLKAEDEQIRQHHLQGAATLSNRLHCLLLGAIHGCVPLALTDHSHAKVTSLFETVGWRALTLDIDQYPADHADQALNRLAEYRKRVLAKHDELHSKANQQLMELLSN